MDYRRQRALQGFPPGAQIRCLARPEPASPNGRLWGRATWSDDVRGAVDICRPPVVERSPGPRRGFAVQTPDWFLAGA